MKANKKHKKILLHLQYQGTRYHGWQKQSITQETVQHYVDEALFKRSGERIKTLASGRTDTGVHARKQAVMFQYQGDRDIHLDDWIKGINVFLPKDIRVLGSQYVADDFHVIGSVQKKIYRYFFRIGRTENMFLSHCVVRFPHDLDLDKMKKALLLFKGEKSFHSFQTSSDPIKETIRKIYDINVKRMHGELHYVEFIGSGFLRHMVRNLMGAAVAVGRKKAKLNDIKQALKPEIKIKIGSTAPPEGLFLWDVKY